MAAATFSGMESELTFSEVRLADPRLPTEAGGARAPYRRHLAVLVLGCAAMVIMLAAVLAGLKS